MSIRKAEAIAACANALRAGRTLYAPGYGGGHLTAGRDIVAVGPAGLAGYWYRGRLGQREVHLPAACAVDLAAWFVERAGRGAAARAARAAEQKASGQ